MTTINASRLVLILAAALTTATLTVAQLGVIVRADRTKETASAALTQASATAAIQSCAFEARNQLIFDMDSRLKLATNILLNLSSSARLLPEPAQEKLASALEDIKIQEAALRMGMESVQKATAKAWPRMRATLAFNYMDYVGAVSRAELLVFESKGA